MGSGISFFDRLDKDVAPHLVEAKAYKTGIVALGYEVQKQVATEARVKDL